MSKLSCQVIGSGKDLVLIHGWGMNAGVWTPFLPWLKGYRVTMIELPGHGESDWTGADTLSDWTEQVMEVAPENAIWCGWSLGGQIALQAALQTKQRVSQLILITSTPKFAQADGWDQAIVEDVFKQFGEQLMADPSGTLRRFLTLQISGSSDARNTLNKLRFAMKDRKVPNLGALQAGLRLLLQLDLRQSLPELDVPSFWLFGNRDMLVPASVGNELKMLLPGAQVETIMGAAHAPFLSHPEECSNLMKAFIEHV